MSKQLDPTNIARIALFALFVLFYCAAPALASVETDIFGSSSPLEKFAGFITGPFAFFLALIAFVAFGFMLAVGNDFTGLARRVPTTLLGVAFVVLAVNAVNFLFSGSAAGAMLLPGEVPNVR